MLMYGTSMNVVKDAMVYNLASLNMNYPRLPYLIPPNSIGKTSGRDFDLAYMHYIMDNDLVFKQFFDIVYLLYIGHDVYLITSEEEWAENLTESLLKLIQQRYGYNSCRINSPEDYIHFSNTSGFFEFNPYFGIQNLDTDKERYTYIVEKFRLSNQGPLLYT